MIGPRRVLLILLAMAGMAGPALADIDASQKQAELSELRSRISALQAQLSSARGELDGERRRLMELETEIGQLIALLRELTARQRDAESTLRALGDERRELDIRLGIQRETLREQIRAAYAMGRQERLKILLNQESPDRVSRVLRYHDYFQRARSRAIDEIGSSLVRLAELEFETERTRSRVANLRSEQEARRVTLEASRDERSEVIARLNADIQSKSGQLEEMAADERRLQKLLEQLRVALIDIPPDRDDGPGFKSQRGRLPWPTRGKLARKFNSPREGDLRWSGVVIDAREGDEIRSVARGRVAFAGWLRGFGLLTVVDHGEGYMSLYGYSQTLYKETGDWVEPGEPLAQVGASGGRPKPSLYFEIRRDGKPQDPRRWCVRGEGLRVGALSIDARAFAKASLLPAANVFRAPSPS